MAPDVVNRTFYGNDVEAVLDELNFKARVHGTELVGIADMAPAFIKEHTLVVHEAFEPGLHERGRSQDRFSPIRVMNLHGETTRGKPEGDERRGGKVATRTVPETHGRNERFEAIG